MKKILLIIFCLLAACTLCGCAASHRANSVAERIAHDTLYKNQLLHDSIYIDNWYYTYEKADTVYIDKIRYEYRYRMMHDTIREVRIDTIPHFVEVEVTRGWSHIPWVVKVLAIIGMISLVILLQRLYVKR